VAAKMCLNKANASDEKGPLSRRTCFNENFQNAADLLFSGVPTLADLMVKTKASVASVGAHLRPAAVRKPLHINSPAFENAQRMVIYLQRHIYCGAVCS